MNACKYFALAITLGLGLVAQAQASTISLSADNQWNEFSVDDFSSISTGVEWIDTSNSNSLNFGTANTYQFTVASGYKGFLSVVDAGFAGDRFQVFNNGQSLGLTSLTSNSIDYSNNFDSNLLDANFSSTVFELAAGTYSITGELASTLQPFNATNGALKLEVAAVPLPGALGLFLGGMSLLALVRRRRA